uniref:Zinc finger protein-like 1 homolog n=1 Tax=Heterorhabditis bacteriophora TaxID=37862 RepID=A0A1I7XLA8_HETBA
MNLHGNKGIEHFTADVLHWACLDRWARQLPPTTAPAGYKCPFCREALFPASNQVSPIIDQLCLHLQRSNWGRIGLGLPNLLESEDIAPSIPGPTSSEKFSSITPIAESRTLTDGQYTNEPSHVQHKNRAKTPETILEIDDASYSGPSQEVTFTSRKKHFGSVDTDSQPLLSNEKDADSELNKYKRRPAGEWLTGIWKAKYGKTTPNGQFSGYKRALFIIFLCAILLVTFISVMTRVSSVQEGDPMLDPMANPNIRVAADDSIPSVK